MTTTPLTVEDDETGHRPGPHRRKGKSRAPSLEQLRAGRTVWAALPSGHEFLIRPPNMEMYAMSGGLPTRLRRMAGTTAAELNRTLADDEGGETLFEARDYLLGIVRGMVVEPDLSGLQSFEELDAVLLPEDFHFLLEVGQRERDVDALGRKLWGFEPLSRWDTFREEHGCAEDCEACAAVLRRFTVASVQ